MAQGSERPSSLPSERTAHADRMADPLPSFSSGLAEAARRMRLDAPADRDATAPATDDVADRLARARQLSRHPRMQRLARR